MNRLQLLLGKLAEEANEVAQMALKTQQFGLHESCAGQPFTNEQRLHGELNDFMAIIEMLNNEYDFKYIRDRKWMQHKKNMVNKYADKSAQLGVLTHD